MLTANDYGFFLVAVFKAAQMASDETSCKWRCPFFEGTLPFAKARSTRQTTRSEATRTGRSIEPSEKTCLVFAT